jgi:hypothetical protein
MAVFGMIMPLRQRIKQSRYLRAIFLFFFVNAVVSAGSPSVSGDFTDRRITAGARIFRALLAADVDIARKTGNDGRIRLCLLYVDDVGNAVKARETLLSRGDSRIREMELSIEVLTFDHFLDYKPRGFAGLFLTQSLADRELRSLIHTANEARITLFSPLEGDVERGVPGGIAVEARVRPYLNMKALHDAGVRLKPFFVRVAKRYEK